jgi:hypothetical protein
VKVDAMRTGNDRPRDVNVLDSVFGLIGRLDGVHVDPEGGAWAAVELGGGLAAPARRLVPLEGARLWSGYLRLACSRHVVRTAPEAPDGPLLEAGEAALLHAHYAAGAA